MGLSKIMNERGMGLVPFLIMTGVVGIIVAGMASSIVTMLRSQTSVTATTEANLLADQLKAALTNESACANALSGKAPDNVGAGVDPVTPITSLPVRLADTDMNLSEGGALVDSSGLPIGYTIYKLRMKYDDLAPVGTNGIPTLADGADLVWNRRVKVVLQLQKTGDGIFSPMSQPKEFYIDANIKQADMKIKGCAARSVASEACFQMGGVWNPSVDPSKPVEGNRCQSNQFCQYGGSYSDPTTPVQAAFNNTMLDGPAEPGTQCPLGFQPKQTGAVALAAADSKSNLTTTVAPIYSCLRCAQQDRSTYALNAFAATDTVAAAYIIEANSQTDAAIATNTMMSTTCRTALQTSGTWNAPVYAGTGSCSANSGVKTGTCDPRATNAGPATCWYISGYDATTGAPIWASYSSTYTQTCTQTTALPAQCHYP